ncbi:MAG: hypothetical protein FWB80_00695 [Defluviitaleaceae bacterium]|nr:hypothetical protein [Defluviitaleaceae bacterium]
MRWMPNLKTNAPFTVGQAKDSFKPGKRDVLLAASRAIDIQALQTSDVRSVPDIFYDACMYEMMMHSDGEDVKDSFFVECLKQIEYEWRALFAFLVLSKTMSKPVKAESLLKSNQPSRFPLEQIAITHIPKRNIWNEQGSGWTWEDSVLFTLHNDDDDLWTPIAMSSPTTIIVPAADCWNTVMRNYHFDENSDERPDWIRCWSNNRPKTSSDDPVKLLGRDYAQIMWSWLSAYQKFLLAKAKDSGKCLDMSMANNLCAEDLTNSNNDGIITRYKKALEIEYGFKKDGSSQGSYEIKNIADLLAERRSLDYSDVKMFKNVTETYIFIDCEKVSSGEKIGDSKPSDLKAYGVLSLPALLSNRKERSRELNELNIFPHFSDELLMNEISTILFDKAKDGNPAKSSDCASVVLQGEGVVNLPNTSPEDSGCYLIAMPLTEKGIGLFQKCEEAGSPIKYSISAINTGKIKIKMQIPMQPDLPGVMNGYYEYEREYVGVYDPTSNPNGTIRQTMVGSACEAGIWPNRSIDGWNTYFYFCYRTKSQTDSISYMKPYGENKEPDSSHQLSDHEVVDYYEFNEFPRFLTAYNGRDEIVGYIPLNTNHYTPSPVDGEQNYHVYLDFGTSATVFYRKIDGKMKDSQKFSGGSRSRNDLVAGIICSNPDRRSVNGKYFNQLFFPDSSIDVPFPSLLHDFWSVKHDRRRKHVLDARIFFKQLERTYTNPSHGFVISNLKWSNSEINTFRTNVYFEHLVRLIGLDAHINGCTSLLLYQSYPGAMNKYDEYLSRTKNIFVNTLSNDSSNVRFTSGGDITEGQAAAQFFNTKIVPARCVIDIGGGSSDLFLYVQSDHDGVMKFVAKDSSIKFGARDVLVRVLRENAERHRQSGAYDKTYLHRLASSSSLDLYSEGGHPEKPISAETIKAIVSEAGSEERFVAELEEFLARIHTTNTGDIAIGDKLHEALRLVNPKHEQNDRNFLTLLAVNMAATVYYAGILARKIEHSFDSIELSFAGNGSKMLHWLGEKNTLDKFLRRVFFEAIARKDLAPQMAEKRKAEQEVFDCKADVASVTSALGTAKKDVEEKKIDLSDAVRKVERLENAAQRIKDATGVSDTQTEEDLTSARESVIKIQKNIEDLEKKVAVADVKLSIANEAYDDALKVLERYAGALTNAKDQKKDDIIGTVSVEIAEQGKLVASNGMSFDKIPNVSCERLIIAGEAYNTIKGDSVVSNPAEGKFDKDSISIMDGGRWVSSGISYDTVKEDEFIAFCHAFNDAVKDAFGNDRDRRVLALNIFTRPNEDIGPQFEIGDDNVWRGKKKHYLNSYFEAVLSEKQGGDTVEDVKSLFFIEVQALFDIMLEKFGVDR